MGLWFTCHHYRRLHFVEREWEVESESQEQGWNVL